MTAVHKFILALITTLSSTTFRFRVNLEKLFSLVINRVITGFSFLQITRKRKVVELRVVISANINMHIASNLSPKTSHYDLQKRKYDFAKIAIGENCFRDLRGNGRSLSLELL